MTAVGESKIDEYLARLKAEGKSAPAGRYWDDFYKRITRGAAKPDRPSVPLILAGSIASDAEKHARLRQHLEWADGHDRLSEALTLLDDIPREGWNIGSPETWTQSFSWEDDA